jgi:serine/threonine protein kinase
MVEESMHFEALDRATDALDAGPRTTIVMPDGREPIELGSGVISGFLGEGGMANVYAIWNSQLEVFRAVKLINPNCSSDARERFKTEFKICAKLHHPNIIEIYGVGKWRGLPYIEMEKIDGLTLDTLIKTRGALPTAVCTAIGIMISRALLYAHNQDYMLYGNTYRGVIHRDLKPANIMLCRNGTVKLMDFGIASPAEASFHTMTGNVLGTLHYLSPEQLEGRKLDNRTDIYSLGCSLYEAITGKMAFDESNVHKLMMDKLKSRYAPIEHYDIKLPLRLRRVIYGAMRHERRKRIPDAQTLLRDLLRVHASLGEGEPEQVVARFVASQPTTKAVLKTRRTIAWSPALVGTIAVAAVLSFVLFGVFYGVKQRNQASLKNRSLNAAPAESSLVLPSSPPPATNQSPLSDKVKTVTPALTQNPDAGSENTELQAADGGASVGSQTTLQRLAQKYGTANPLDMLIAEFRAGQFQTVVELYEYLSAEQKQRQPVGIYMLRSLTQLGNRAELKRFVNSGVIHDGEYYLARARLAWDSRSVESVIEALNQSLQAPRLLMGYEELRREEQYLRAQCLTHQFDRTPSEENYRQVMDGWFQLKSTLRQFPEHEYNTIALNQTQRIGQKFREQKP